MGKIVTGEFELLSDLYKDARGSRPSVDYMRHFESLPHEEKLTIWDRLNEEVAESIDEDARLEAAAKLRWDSHIARMMSDCNIDRATALRWDMQAMDAYNGDVLDAGYYCYLWGLSFTLAKEIAKQVPNCAKVYY